MVEAYREGLFWRDGRDEDSSRAWTRRTRNLIEAALGTEKADLFVDEAMARWAEEDKEKDIRLRSIWMDERLNPLHKLIGEVDSVRHLHLRSDFNGSEWVSKK